jgi:hypothetical protein
MNISIHHLGIIRDGFKGGGGVLHRTEIESTDFIETFDFLRLGKLVCILSNYKK